MTLPQGGTARSPFIHSARCALLVLAALISPAFAQPTGPTSPGTRIDVEENRKAGDIEFEYQLPGIEIVTQTVIGPSTRCSAGIPLFSYAQKDTTASFEGTLENTGCAASSGEYVVAITIRDDKGELQTLEFTTAWQRNDAEPLALEANYPIGENVDLLRVRARRVSCTCAEAPVEPRAGE
jgi:hypothetical protein